MANIVRNSLWCKCLRKHFNPFHRLFCDAVPGIKIEYALADSSEYETLNDMLWNYYRVNEVVYDSLSITQPNKWIDEHAFQIMKQGHTFVAKRQDNKEAVGAIMCELVAKEKAEKATVEANKIPDKATRSLFQFEAFVLNKPKIFEKYSTNQLLDIKMFLVRREYQFQGIGMKLWVLVRKHALKKDIAVVRADATNLHTRRLCGRMGFQKVHTLKFIDFQGEDGKPIISSIHSHKNVKTYIDEETFLKSKQPKKEKVQLK